MLAAGAVAARAGDGREVGHRRADPRGRAPAVELASSGATRSSDTFVEMVAAPWFANAAAGTPALALWLRTLGARIGRGVWCETYWLPEADLVTLGDGATVNRGCVLQTHLFHDRVMSMDTVTSDRARRSGPHSVILPGRAIGADATVGPASLVMRGEHVPAGTPLGRQPDRALAAARDGSTRCADATPDPYLPQRRRPRLRRRVATTWTLDYRVDSNRLDGTRRDHRGGHAARCRGSASTSSGCGCRRCAVDGRRPRALHSSATASCDITPRAIVGPAPSSPSTSQYGGNPEPVRSAVGRRRLGGARPTACSSPASRAARRPGSRATTIPATRRRYRITVTDRVGVPASSRTGVLVSHRRQRPAGRPGSTTSASPWRRYLVTVQIGRYDAAVAGRLAGADASACCPARGCAREFDADFAPAAGDDRRCSCELLRARTRSAATRSSSPPTSWRSRSRRRASRSSAANHLDGRRRSERLVAHELAHQWFGNSLTVGALAATSGCTRASPATPSGCGRRRRAGRRADEQAPGATTRGSPACRRTSSLGDPGPGPMFDDRALQARRADPARAARLPRRRRVLRPAAHLDGPLPARLGERARSSSSAPRSRATPRWRRSCTRGCTSAALPAL